MNKEEIQRIEKIINKCRECRLHECIQCEISYADICAISRLYNEMQAVKDKLEELNKLNIEDNKSVKRFEEMRRNTTDEFHKKSYQKSIHKLNAQIETRKHIINDFKEVIEN